MPKKKMPKINANGEMVGGLECLNVYVAPEFKTTIERLAKQESMSMSTLLRQALIKQYRREIKELSGGDAS